MRDLRRFFASRLLRTGLLFLFLVGAPTVGGAYRCCSTGNHDGGHRASHDSATAPSANANHTDAHPTRHESQAPAEHGTSGGAPCTCVDHCCAPPAIALLAHSVRLPVETPLVATRAAIIDRAHRLDSRDAHLLPFGNGPPRILAS